MLHPTSRASINGLLGMHAPPMRPRHLLARALPETSPRRAAKYVVLRPLSLPSVASRRRAARPHSKQTTRIPPTAAARAVRLSTSSGRASAVVTIPIVNSLPSPVVAPRTVGVASLLLGRTWQASSIGVAPPLSRFPALLPPPLKSLLRHSADSPPMSLDRFALLAVQIHWIITIASLSIRE